MVAGDADALDQLHTQCETDDIRARKIPVDYASHTSHVERIEDELALVLADIQPQPATTPLFSTLHGQWLDTTTMGATYWYDNLRHQVRFGESIEHLVTEDFRTFVEISAHPVVSMAVQDILDTHADTPSLTTGTLRRNEDTTTRFLTSLATLHVRGTPVDWQPAYGDTQPTRVELPTYPFQRTRYWLERAGKTSDVSGAGIDPAEHPLLGALVELPESGGVLATGRLSLKTHPWLADHAVSGTVLVPGAALVELAVRAGDQAGTGLLDELVIEAPLALPASGAVRVQVAVGGLDGFGRRPVTLHARAEDSESWVRHATGFTASTATSAAGSGSSYDFGVWPPQGAEALSVDDFYDLRYAAGYEYGPVFQGLRKVWRRGEELFAEVALPDDVAGEAAAFGLHPALLDAALHTAAFGSGPQGADGRTLLPFAWNRVALHATGAARLRIRIAPQGADTVTVEAADTAGAPVATVDGLTFRAVDPSQLSAEDDPLKDSVFRVEWQPVAVPDTATGDDWPVLDLTDSDDEDIRTLTGRVLSTVQDLLATDPDDTRLVVLTHDAVTVPEQAAVWGLIRTAQNEHPDRIVLVDTDPQSRNLLHTALATGEPQLALRGGKITVPRLARTTITTTDKPLDPNGTVLITGGTGTLGALTAHHLITHHHITHLHLISRRGPQAPGADQLQRDLTALGAHVTITATDATNPTQVTALLNTLHPDHPLTAVIHTAGVLDDATITTQTPHHLDTAYGAKTDAAHVLHQATKNHNLAAFLLFSSAAGTLGNPGQANYAAANAALDAYAHHLRTQGTPATSLAWGLWADASGMTGHLDSGDQSRMSRQGAAALTAEEGMALLDAGLRSSEPALVTSKMNFPALRAAAVDGRLPVILRGLVRLPRKAAHSAADAPESLADQIAALPEADRQRRLLDLVRGHASTVLGDVPIRSAQPFKDVGFDSLTAVELRNRLATATGIRLPATLIFDYPTPAALARHLQSELVPEDAADDVATVAGAPARSAAEAEAATAEELGRIAAMDADDLVARALGAIGN
ncbi:SDR family NAD(P)-dependent oxidoreductase [Streptomyces chryseus]